MSLLSSSTGVIAFSKCRVLYLGDRVHGRSPDTPLLIRAGSGQSRTDFRIPIRSQLSRGSRAYGCAVVLAGSLVHLVPGPAKRHEPKTGLESDHRHSLWILM